MTTCINVSAQDVNSYAHIKHTCTRNYTKRERQTDRQTENNTGTSYETQPPYAASAANKHEALSTNGISVCCRYKLQNTVTDFHARIIDNLGTVTIDSLNKPTSIYAL